MAKTASHTDSGTIVGRRQDTSFRVGTLPITVGVVSEYDDAWKVMIDDSPVGRVMLYEGRYTAALTEEPSEDLFPKFIGTADSLDEAKAMVAGAWRMDG